MQLARFDNGGFVLHAVALRGVTASAWFDAAGVLLDAEYRTGGIVRYMRPVTRNGPMWRDLQVTGRAYVQPTASAVVN